MFGGTDVVDFRRTYNSSGSGLIVKATGKTGINTGSTPNAMLDVKGLGTLAGMTFQTQDSASVVKFQIYDSGHVVLTPMTTTVRDSITATNGMLCYNSTLNKFQLYENGYWVNAI